jgi:hypothetical protein
MLKNSTSMGASYRQQQLTLLKALTADYKIATNSSSPQEKEIGTKFMGPSSGS